MNSTSAVDALLGRDTPEKREICTRRRVHAEQTRWQTVMHGRNPSRVGQRVPLRIGNGHDWDIGELVVERQEFFHVEAPVQRCHMPNVRQPTHHRVVKL